MSFDVNDSVYGPHVFDEPVLIQLLESESLKRLKGISQWGIPDRYYFRKGFSRFEHSVGVAVLLQKLGASLEEVIAGLLHDISHPAFSHIIDGIMGTESDESFQDSMLKEFISKGEIAEILRKHGFNPDKFYQLEKFPLLERPVPEICADRIDYALREMVLNGEEKRSEWIFSELTVKNNRLVFKSLKAAKEFGQIFFELNRDHWTSYESNGRNKLLQRALKAALDDGIIAIRDLFMDDEKVLKKIEDSDNEIIQSNLKNLMQGKLPPKSEMGPKYQRFADPLFIEGNTLRRVSEVDDAFNSLITRTIPL